MRGIAQLLPARVGDDDAPLSARVFKIERGPDGDRIAYTRLFSGTLNVRDRFGAGRVTALRVFAEGDAVQRDAVHAGEIAKLWGLGEIRIGDWLGEPHRGVEHHFAPPTFEAVVEAVDPEDGQRLSVALGQLAEQDPLIDVRQDDTRAEISVSLYGEVQREVIESTLADDYGVAVAFRETTTICIERPTGSGDAVEILNTPTNPFHADLGLRIEPAPPGSGVEVRMSGKIDPRDAPLYVFKTFDAFAEHMDEYVQLALEEGLHGWRVTDCVVTVTEIAYSLAD
jgi:ribosomal protection tetracycline resistance protein